MRTLYPFAYIRIEFILIRFSVDVCFQWPELPLQPNSLNYKITPGFFYHIVLFHELFTNMDEKEIIVYERHGKELF